ncbi:MAG: CHAT domain-containing protein [Nitrososphaeraceae archaeon]
MGPIKFPFTPEEKFHKIFEEIENPNAFSLTDVDKEIMDIGMSLYEELFPESLKKLYWEKRDRIKSIRIISKEPWIPWEIIKPWRQLENGVGEEDEFLCERYAFSRWIGKTERFKEKIKSIKVIVPEDTNLNAAIKERSWIEEFAKSKNIKIATDSSYDQVINTLETEKEIDILHFSTHGQSDKQNPLLSAIELEGNKILRPKNLVGKAVTFGQSHPIVILNACQTGSQGFSLTGIQGWATKFLEAGASIFIGTLWSVNDETAFNFVTEFYNQLASGTSLGESVKNARNKSKKEGDTSWLAYQLYGHPNCTIKF